MSTATVNPSDNGTTALIEHRKQLARQVTSCFWQDPQASYQACDGSGLSPEMFPDRVHAAIWNLLNESGRTDTPFTQPVIIAALQKAGMWNTGTTHKPGTINRFELDALLRSENSHFGVEAIARELVDTHRRIASYHRIHTFGDRFLDLLDRDVFEDFWTLATEPVERDSPHIIKPGPAAFTEYEANLRSGERPTVYRTGCDAIDAALPQGGFMPSTVTVIGAPPKHAKTALVSQMVFDALRLVAALRVVFATGEMATRWILDRQLSRLAGVHLTNIFRRHFKNHENESAAIADGLTTLKPIVERMTFIEAPLTIAGIRQAVEQADPQILVVDYFQLVRPATRTTDRRAMHDAAMAELIALTKDKNLATICVSSLSRGVGKANRTEYNPNRDMAAFKETGGIEYSADSLFLLETADGKAPEAGNTLDMVLRGIASRHDIPKSARLTFFRPFQRFAAAESDER